MPDATTIADLGLSFLALLVVVVTLLIGVGVHLAYSFRWIGREEARREAIEQEIRREIPRLRESRHTLANSMGRVEGHLVGFEDRLRRMEDRHDERSRDRGL